MNGTHPDDDPAPAATLGPWATGWLVAVLALSLVGVAENLAITLTGGDEARAVLPRFGTAIAVVLVLLGVATGAGAALLLLAPRRAGFWMICGAALAAAAVNLWIGIAPATAMAGLAGPAITWAFLRPRWHLLA